MNITWWAIEFIDGAFGYIKMNDGFCIDVFRFDGTVVQPDEKVEYTCVNINASAPVWA